MKRKGNIPKAYERKQGRGNGENGSKDARDHGHTDAVWRWESVRDVLEDRNIADKWNGGVMAKMATQFFEMKQKEALKALKEHL